MSALFRRFQYLLRRSRLDADLAEEIEAHRAHRQDALERDGLDPADAVHASRRAMGNVTLAVEDARDVWAMRAIDSLRQDIRDSLRGLRKSPGFAHRGRRYSRARHRRQHGAVLDLQQPDPAPAARPRSGQPRAAHRRVVAVSRVGGDSSPRDRAVRRRLRVVGPALRPLAGRPRRARRRRIRKRTVLRRARRTCRTWSPDHAGRRFRSRAGWSGRRHQSSLLASALRRRRRRRRTPTDRATRPVHHRRRHAAGILRRRRRPDDRRDAPLRVGVVDPR